MTKIIDGRTVLGELDTSIVKMRRMVSDAIAAAESTEAREAEIRDEQVQNYKSLAKIRMDIVAHAPDPQQLDKLHQEAAELLRQHADYVRREAKALDEAAAEIAELEQERARLSDAHVEALETYEIKVAEVEDRLSNDDEYKSLVGESEQQSAIAVRAYQKLEIAQEDLETKGVPYESDPLFSYLWKQKFRSPEYKANPLTRMLDGWVARVCKYDQAFLNYQRLTDLPKWIAEHVADQDGKAEAALGALERYEENALEESGANALRKKANDVRAEIETIDKKIVLAEEVHQRLAETHAETLALNKGPAQEARNKLESGLRKASIQDLRMLAAETIDITDDRIVDALVKLRTEEMSLEIESDRLLRMPTNLKNDLDALQKVRRAFKADRFDSPYVSFKTAVVDDVLRGLSSGRVSAQRAVDQLRRNVRRVRPRAQPGFGGSRRSSTIGMPTILGDVMWEIAEEVLEEGMRGGSRSRRRSGSINWPNSGVRRRSTKIKIPSRRSGRRGGSKRSGRSGGGWKTGGGF